METKKSKRQAILRRVASGDLDPLEGKRLIEAIEAEAGGAEQARSSADSQPKAVAELRRPVESRDLGKLKHYLRQLIANRLRVDPGAIGEEDTLEPFGVDSLAVVEIARELEADFGRVSKTLLLEHNTISRLASYLADHHSEVVEHRFAGTSTARKQVGGLNPKVSRGASGSVEMKSRVPIDISNNKYEDGVAIVGVACRFPESDNWAEFWKNLEAEQNCIRQVDEERWRILGGDSLAQSMAKREYQAGLVSNVDRFDSLFFGVPPRDAERMDPQERVFMEVAWECLEDAGYTRQELREKAARKDGSDVGVFVGVMYGPYLMQAMEGGFADPTGVNSAYWSLPNRFSYFADFNGPSVAVDTACSSSLVALHQACEAIRVGDCGAAIAGGVSLMLHPRQYQQLTEMKMLSSGGRCRVFGEGADGLVAAEGVGALLLRPLSEAVRDGDTVWGVIRGSAVNSGGKTGGYTVPNPHAQTGVVKRALAKSGLSSDDLDYVEAHGTGTALGDPLEIRGLGAAFAGRDARRDPCWLGSVKSNIGHTQAAAGIAGLIKVILQLRNDQIVPSLDADPANPMIDFEDTPFRVANKAQSWESAQEPGRVRRAGVSSFGLGGTNAHVIVEEGPRLEASEAAGGEYLFVLSAADDGRLRAYSGRIADWMEREGSAARLADLCYTSLVGREAKSSRLSVLVSDQEQLYQALRDFEEGKDNSSCLVGNVTDRGDQLTHALRDVLTNSQLIQDLGDKEDWQRLATLWVAGFDVDWPQIIRVWHGRRISMPTYPFARVRHWLELSDSPRSESGTLDNSVVTLVVEAAEVSQEKVEGSFESEGAHGQETHSINTDAPEIRRWLVSNIASKLKMERSDVDPEKPFSEYGVDSLTAASVAEDLSHWLSIEVKATMLFDHPSVTSLATHLGSRGLVVEADARTEGKETLSVENESMPVADESNEVDEDLSQLSDAELEARIKALLGKPEEANQEQTPQADSDRPVRNDLSERLGKMNSKEATAFFKDALR